MKELLLNQNASIKEALKVIDSGAKRIAIVVNGDNRVIGTVSDGDIRRAILRGKQLHDSLAGVYQTNPLTVEQGTLKKQIINICTQNKIYQIPIVDSEGKIVDVAILDELIQTESYPNKVVLMVGGLGTRLRPLTETTPKPMLDVGGRPILQTIVEQFATYGFTDIVMCVNYKSKVIRDFFGDGRRFGVKITYVDEKKRMGTAGALSLLPERPNSPFFVMNGDLLTNVNFVKFLEYHMENDAKASMCVREYDFQVPFGVVELDGVKIKNIREKPVKRFFVNAGIYMLEPECIDLVPKGAYFDMPSLFEKMVQQGDTVVSFPLREYWLDIGRIEEYKRANFEYGEIF